MIYHLTSEPGAAPPGRLRPTIAILDDDWALAIVARHTLPSYSSLEDDGLIVVTIRDYTGREHERAPRVVCTVGTNSRYCSRLG